MLLVLLVDDHDHAGLTVLSLGAIQPHGSGSLNLHGVDRCIGIRGIDGLESRVKASHVRHDVVDWHTWRIKGRLHDAVIFGPELKLDHISDSSLEVVWGEGQGAIVTSNANNVNGLLGLAVDCHMLVIWSCCAEQVSAYPGRHQGRGATEQRQYSAS